MSYFYTMFSFSVQIKHGFDEPLETRTPNNMIKIMYSSNWVYGSYWANRVESSILITLSSDCCIDLFASLSIRSFSLSMLRLTELVRFELTNVGIKILCLDLLATALYILFNYNIWIILQKMLWNTIKILD